MTVERFRTIEEMAEAPVIVSPGEGFERFARQCARYWKFAPRVYPRGVFRFRALAEAQAARERVTDENVARLRAAASTTRPGVFAFARERPTHRQRREAMLRFHLMRIVTDADRIPLDELRRLAAGRFGDMVKAVVDLKRRVMVVDADLHADQEALWGINLYPDLPEADWLEFDSMINLRPSFGNRSRGVDDPGARASIAVLVRELVSR